MAVTPGTFGSPSEIRFAPQVGQTTASAASGPEHHGQTRIRVGGASLLESVGPWANPTAPNRADDSPSVRGGVRTRSLPFDRRRRLRADVVDDPVDAGDLIDDPRRDLAEDVVRELGPVGGHPVLQVTARMATTFA